MNRLYHKLLGVVKGVTAIFFDMGRITGADFLFMVNKMKFFFRDIS